MASFVFNVGLGRTIELYKKVKGNDPANCAFVIVAIDANGDSDATMRDRLTLSELLGGLANEVTNTNYSRLVLTDADLVAFPGPDLANDKYVVDMPDLNWVSILAGSPWTDLILCFDPDTTGGDDTSIIPLICFDFPMTPDGSNITAIVNASGFFQATPV